LERSRATADRGVDKSSNNSIAEPRALMAVGILRRVDVGISARRGKAPPSAPTKPGGAFLAQRPPREELLFLPKSENANDKQRRSYLPCHHFLRATSDSAHLVAFNEGNRVLPGGGLKLKRVFALAVVSFCAVMDHGRRGLSSRYCSAFGRLAM